MSSAMRLVFFAVGLFLGNYCLAQEIPVKPGFEKRWHRTKTFEWKSKKNEIIQARLLTRFTTIGARYYPIGSVQFFQYPRLTKKPSAKEYLEPLTKAYGFKNWQRVKGAPKGVVIYEGFYKAGNRFLRYAFKETGTHTLVSLADLRKGYMDGLKGEAHVMQMELIRKGELAQKKKSSSLWKFFEVFPQAFAQYNLGGFQFNLPEGSSIPDLSQNTDFMNQVADLSDIGTEVGRFVDEVAASREVVQETNDRAAELSATLRHSTDTADKHWGKTNELFEKALDPANAAKLAFAGAAGAVVGSAVANLAIKGFTSGIKVAIDKITDRKGKKIRWELFQEARKNYEATEANAIALERKLDRYIDQFSGLQKYLKDNNLKSVSKEEILRHLSRRRRNVEKRIKQLTEAYERIPGDNKQCEDLASDTLYALEGNLKALTGQIEALERVKFKVFDDKMFCDQLNFMVNQLAQAEGALQTYRTNILNGKTEWRNNANKQLQEMVDSLERANKDKTAKKFMDESIKSAEKTHKNTQAFWDNQKKEAIKKCKQSKAGLGYYTDRFRAPKDMKMEMVAVTSPTTGKLGFELDRSGYGIPEQCQSEYTIAYIMRDLEELQKAQASVFASADKKEEELRQRREQSINHCIVSRNGQGVYKEDPEPPTPKHFAKPLSLAQECEQGYEAFYSRAEKQAMAAAEKTRTRFIEDAKKEYKRFPAGRLANNLATENQKIQGYLDWFNKLELQSYCQSKAHHGEKKCQELKKIGFMGFFDIQAKASMKLKNVCGQENHYSY